jgi:hypothetical protein
MDVGEAENEQRLGQLEADKKHLVLVTRRLPVVNNEAYSNTDIQHNSLSEFKLSFEPHQTPPLYKILAISSTFKTDSRLLVPCRLTRDLTKTIWRAFLFRDFGHRPLTIA